jgi:O-antigen/teichoic acid export membrane protein
MSNSMTKIGESVRVGRNTAHLTGAQLFSQISSAVYVAVLARYILADGMGQIAIAQAATGIAFIFVTLGLDTLVIRDIARDPTQTDAYLTGSLWIRAGLGVVACIGLAIFATVAGYPGDTRVIIYLYAVGTVLRCLTATIASVWQAHEAMSAVSTVRVVRDIINVGLSLAAIAAGASLVVIVGISVFANVIELALSVIMRPVKWRFQPHVTLTQLRELLVRNLPFAGLAIVNVLYVRSIVMLLSFDQDQSTVGNFSSAQIMVTFLLVVPSMFGQALLPTLSRMSATTTAVRLPATFTRAFRLTWGLGAVLGVTTIFFAGPMMRLMFGPNFDAAVPVFQIIGLSLFASPNHINGALLNATGHQKLFSLSQVGFTVFQVLLAVVLIPPFRIIGAAIAYTLPTLLGFVYYSFICYRSLTIGFPWKLAAGLLATTGVTWVILVLGSQLGLSWIVGFMSGLLVFIAMAGMTHIVDMSDLSLLLQSLLPQRVQGMFMRLLPVKKA